jgi:hypothetical protein
MALVGTLNLYLELPGKMQKKSVQTDDIQNVLQNRHFTDQVKCDHILARFGRFLSSRLIDSFCIGSGYSRHKFRVPARPILERKMLTLFYTMPLLRGVE